MKHKGFLGIILAALFLTLASCTPIQNEDIEIIPTSLFNDAYSVFVEQKESIIYDNVLAYIESLSYEFEAKHPIENNGLGIIQIHSSIGDGDRVAIIFADEPAITIISYHQALSGSEVAKSNHSNNKAIEYDEYRTKLAGEYSVEVSGIEDQIKFLFAND